MNRLLPSLLVLALCIAPALHATVVAPPAADAAQASWQSALAGRLAAIDAAQAGDLGVFVLDLASGATASWQGDQAWYLASGVKVPVAIAVLRAVERGELSLAGKITLQADDLVDGAGPTVHSVPGTALRVDWLLEQMLVHSDNTATDVLIRVIGLDVVNAVADELMGRPARITTLADVRRHAYSALHPDAATLDAEDLLALRRASFGRERMRVLARRLGVPEQALLLDAIVPAFEAYYGSGLNSAPLDAYAGMLAALAQGRALGAEHSAWLLDLMARAATGRRRIVAGLPPQVRFAHKTGTQLRRQCDFGIVSVAPGKEVVVAACVRDAPSLAAGEAMLRAVGEALAASGALEPPPPSDGTHARLGPAATAPARGVAR